MNFSHKGSDHKTLPHNHKVYNHIPFVGTKSLANSKTNWLLDQFFLNYELWLLQWRSEDHEVQLYDNLRILNDELVKRYKNDDWYLQMDCVEKQFYTRTNEENAKKIYKYYRQEVRRVLSEENKLTMNS